MQLHRSKHLAGGSVTRPALGDDCTRLTNRLQRSYKRASKSRFFDGPLDFRPSFRTLEHHRNATRKRRYRADLRSFGRKAHQAFYNAELEQGFDSVEAD